MKPKLLPLTPYEKVLVEALRSSPEGLSFQILASLQVPVKPPAAMAHNRLAVHMKNLRKKGIKIENVRGVGYRIEPN